MNKIIYKEIPYQVKEIKDDERKVVGIVTKEVTDDDGDIIEVNGISLERFSKGGIPLLWAHDSWAPPIGKATFIQKVGDQIIAEFQYATADENAFADTIYKLTKGGYINSFSISIALKYNDPNSVERLESGAYRIKSSKLLEISAVNIPANQEANIINRQLSKALKDEIITEEEKDSFETFVKSLEAERESEDDKKGDEDFATLLARIQLELNEDDSDDNRSKKLEQIITKVCKDCGGDLICPICNQIHKSTDGFAWIFSELERPSPTKEDDAATILKALKL